MTESTSYVHLHPDGYVEMVLVGVCDDQLLQPLIAEVKSLVAEHGPIHGLIDARNGRAGRDARSLSQILRMGRIPKLRQIYLLYTPNSSNPNASPGPGLIASLVMTALGIAITYITDETEARTKATQI